MMRHLKITSHVKETDLALFLSGDMGAWSWIAIQLHTAKCEPCRARIQAYRLDRERLKADCSEMPAGVDWDRMSAEMTANIRVGLAAGECVAPRGRKRTGWGWRPVAIGAGAMALLMAAFWLNLPAASDTASLERVLRTIVHGRSGAAPSGSDLDEREAVVEASPSGIEWRENGNKLRMPQGESRLVSVSVDGQGSASARYIEPDTGQITINSVYVQ